MYYYDIEWNMKQSDTCHELHFLIYVLLCFIDCISR